MNTLAKISSIKPPGRIARPSRPETRQEFLAAINLRGATVSGNLSC
jgi:hypothetical protein